MSNKIQNLRDRMSDGSFGPSMVSLPGGTFTMGDDESPFGDEKPAHQVDVDDFAIGQYPVTFEEYDKFCEDTGKEKPDDHGWGRGKRPVIDVSYDDALAYCKWLSEQTGESYSLPTEEQWEYACRAGSQSKYFFGEDERDLDQYAWYWVNSGRKTHPVGEKSPNAWQLYDMYGNVLEWVLDEYSEDAYRRKAGGRS